ncbi:MAG TPA: Ig-like domain-containing protein [Vicinamibacterales bacterium]|jgi:adhesin/invasin
MIPDLSSTDFRGVARRKAARGRIVPALAVCGLALVAACEKVPLFAPTGTTITLYSNAQVVALNGTAQISASIVESGGNPVQNGTLITFTTSLGTLSPAEARTNDGKATVALNAGTQSGTAEINAFSGSNSAKSTVKILIGSAAVTAVTATASPSSVPSTGGTSTITATVVDTNSNPLPGVPVTFTTDLGTVTPGIATTNSGGQASCTLSTSQSSTVTVTAGSKVTTTVKVVAIDAPTVTLTGPGTTPSVGLSTTFTVNVTKGASSGAPIRSATIDFGDSSGLLNLGALTGSASIPHIYLKSGTFTVTATATDANFLSNSVSIPVNVFPAVPFTLTVTAPSARVGTAVTISATPSAGAPAITSYRWDFGDGTSTTTTVGSASKVYFVVPVGNQVVVSVTATGSDGRIGVGSTVVFITL